MALTAAVPVGIGPLSEDTTAGGDALDIAGARLRLEPEQTRRLKQAVPDRGEKRVWQGGREARGEL